MSPIKVVVHGAMGRMGQVMLKAVCDDSDLEAVGAVDLDELGEEPSLPSAPQNIPYSTTLEPILVETAPSVLVDFTTAEATMSAVRIAVNCGVHLVIGTTGLSSQNIDEIDTLCQEKGLGAVVAPNFALGAVLMMHLAKEAARFFDYAEIIEMHHEKKIDAPSGTAIATARAMVEKRGQPFSTVITQKETLKGTRGGEQGGVVIHSVRAPGLVAHQEVILGGVGQTLTIRHDTIGRECYIPGVLRAIKEVTRLKGVTYGLENLLGL